MTARELPVLPVITRSCGTCTACCTTLGVPEIGKAAGERCAHIRNSRCGIYADRPQSCRDFSCLWLQGIVPVGLRPDKSRVVVGTNAKGDMLVLYVRPEDEGAHRKGPFGAWLARVIGSRMSAYVVCGEKRFLVGPLADSAAGRAAIP